MSILFHHHCAATRIDYDRLTTAGIDFRPLPSDDPKQRKPDIAQAAQTLGWQPTVPLATGLVKTIAYFQTQPH